MDSSFLSKKTHYWVQKVLEYIFDKEPKLTGAYNINNDVNCQLLSNPKLVQSR